VKISLPVISVIVRIVSFVKEVANKTDNCEVAGLGIIVIWEGFVIFSIPVIQLVETVKDALDWQFPVPEKMMQE